MHTLSLSALLLATALPALAQTAPLNTPPTAPAAPRFSVGLHAYSSSYYTPLRLPSGTTGLPLPVQLSVGYQLRPRLAVQASVAYLGYRTTYSPTYLDLRSAPPAAIGAHPTSGRGIGRHVSAAVLARYTLTRQAGHRVQFDLLGGLGFEYSSLRRQGTDSLAQPAGYDYTTTRRTLLLGAGLGPRVRLTPRLELTSDLLLYREIALGTYGPPVTASASVGLRYRFGR